MNVSLIKISFKQIIDSSSDVGSFEKKVFHETYNEFLIQSQSFNPDNRYTTWREIKKNIPKANLSIHYKVGFAIGLYMKELNNLIPNLTDSLGNSCLPFVKYQLQVLESDITNKAKHKVAIIYETDTLTLFNIIGEHLVIAVGYNPSGSDQAFLLKMQPNLSIVSYREIKPVPMNSIVQSPISGL